MSLRLSCLLVVACISGVPRTAEAVPRPESSVSNDDDRDAHGRLRSAAPHFAVRGTLPQDPEEQSQEQELAPPPVVDPLPGDANAERADVMNLAPALHGAELRAAADLAYERGLEYLVARQNFDGSWGSHDPLLSNLKDFGFGTGNRGSNDGVRIACTAIVGKALLRERNRTPEVQAAFDRAIEALLTTDRFAYEMGEAFNTWGYGYKLDFLCDFLESDEGQSHKEKIKAAMQVCVDGLIRFQQVDGGWNYYAGPTQISPSMSFNTANFVEAIGRAKRLGADVEQGRIDNALTLLGKMRTRRGGYVYDARFLNDAGSVNELSSPSRTAAATEALIELGLVDDEEVQRTIAVFAEGENWLEDGRKLIQPHTAVHQISGYFFFYGYHYMAEILHRLGDQIPAERWERMAWTMVRTQELDGSWWDTPAASYGDKWGTGFSLLVLQRYFEQAPDAPVVDTDTGTGTGAGTDTGTGTETETGTDTGTGTGTGSGTGTVPGATDSERSESSVRTAAGQDTEIGR